MANQLKEIGYPGGTLRLNISLRDPITKEYADADSLPTITITDPVTNIIVIAGATVSQDAGVTGKYYYDYVISTSTSISDKWKSSWNITYKGYSFDAEEIFQITNNIIVDFSDDTFDPNSVTIDIPTLNRIKSPSGFPRISNTLLSDTEIKQYAIVPALNEYFARYPEKFRQSFEISSDLVVPFPDLSNDKKEVYGVASIRIATQEGIGSGNTRGGDFWELVHFNSIGAGALGSPYGGKYGTPYQWEVGQQTYYSQKQMFDSVQNLGTKSFFINSVDNQVEVSTTLGGTLAITWAVRSLDFSNVKFSRLEDVIKLCQANMLDYMANLTGIIDDATIQKKFNSDLMRQRSDTLREEVINKWNEYPHIVLLRPE